MSGDISAVKVNFEQLKGLRGEIIEVLGVLKTKLQMVRSVYLELIQTHGKGVYLFGIDSLYFQHSLIAREHQSLEVMNKSIENRLYCEYYKLYQQMKEFIQNDVPDERIKKLISSKKYPPYRNLEPLKVYDFSLIVDLQRLAVSLIVELTAYCDSKNTELETDAAQANLGLNIDNLVNSYKYANAALKARIQMFLDYLKAFHLHHTKYFTRLLLKAKLVLGTINEDIRIQKANKEGKTPPMSPVLTKTEINKVRDKVEYTNSTVQEKEALNEMLGDSDTSVANAPTAHGGSNNEVSLIVAEPSSPTMSVSESDVGSVDHCDITQDDINRRCNVEGYACPGTLLFVGKHVTKGGWRCGVELDEAVGKNNGLVGGHQYFKVDDNKGVLCVPRKIKFLD